VFFVISLAVYVKRRGLRRGHSYRTKVEKNCLSSTLIVNYDSASPVTITKRARETCLENE